MSHLSNPVHPQFFNPQPEFAGQELWTHFFLNHCLINATRSLEIPANVTFFFNYTSFITSLLFYRGHKPCSLTKCIYVTFIGKQTPTGWRLKGCRRCIMMIFSCHKCVTGKSMYWQYESYPNICLCQKASKCFPSHMNWQYRPYHNGTCKL